MKNLDSGKDKIQKICDALRKETLEPAKQEAREIVENAHLQAAEILKEAQNKAQKIVAEANKEIEEKKRVCQSSLQLSCRQAVEQLKQKIEQQLFNKQLAEFVAKEMSDPKLIAHLINSLVRSIEQQGWGEEFNAVIPKDISAHTINALLVSQILHKLEKESVTIGDFAGGVQIRLKDKQMTIDVSDAVIKDLIAQFIRRDFRNLVFNM
ncbi:MAG: V-type ATP synthase subunit E [Chlamydiia bacterium]|nr:V-type ATP synthase subunit E [Chlamydiia bacterium]